MSYVAMPSGLILPESIARAEIARTRLPRAVDLFSGAGGFSLGIIKAGIEVVCAVEHDPICVMTYMTNLCRYGEATMHFVTDADRDACDRQFEREVKRRGKKDAIQAVPSAGSGWISRQPRSVPGVSHIVVGDIRKVTGEWLMERIGVAFGELDLVVGGPPCQGYSLSGKKDVMDPRNSLVFEFARLVLELNPKSMCMEEVPNILNMVTPEGLNVVDALMRVLQDGDFATLTALRRSVAAQTGTVAILRGNKKAASADDPKMTSPKRSCLGRDRQQAPTQHDMFAERPAHA